MKANVDLTLDRDFARLKSNRAYYTKDNIPTLRNILLRYTGFKYPWSFQDNRHMYNYGRNELLLTGSKEDRIIKRKNQRKTDCCTECNNYLHILPWHKSRLQGVCNMCYSAYNIFYNDYDKYPWEQYNKLKSLDITDLLKDDNAFINLP